MLGPQVTDATKLSNAVTMSRVGGSLDGAEINIPPTANTLISAVKLSQLGIRFDATLTQVIQGDPIDIAGYYYQNNTVSLVHHFKSGIIDNVLTRSNIYDSLSKGIMDDNTVYMTDDTKFFFDANQEYINPFAVRVITVGSSSDKWNRVLGAAYGTNVIVIPMTSYDQSLVDILGTVSGKFIGIVIVVSSATVGDEYRSVVTRGRIPEKASGATPVFTVREIDVKSPRTMMAQIAPSPGPVQQRTSVRTGVPVQQAPTPSPFAPTPSPLVPVQQAPTQSPIVPVQRAPTQRPLVPVMAGTPLLYQQPMTGVPLIPRQSVNVADRVLRERPAIVQKVAVWAKNKQWDMIENGHDFIQILFPTKQRSQFANQWLVLTDQDVTVLSKNSQFMSNLFKATIAMIRFYGFMYDQNGIRVYTAQDVATTGEASRRVPYQRFKKYFLAGGAGQHNHRRVTRMLESLTLFGAVGALNAMKTLIATAYKRDRTAISVATQGFWSKYI